MKLIKKLIDWIENKFWERAFKDAFENPEYYFDATYKDGEHND